ncbi:MAG: ABC transporter substrate-binding protein [Lachnospiraceae bacterium]|nr:ABC transporter substrate-binding protein [Lachnospiraceae bacterium]
MKKRVLATVLAMAMAFSLTACGSSSESAAKSEAAAESAAAESAAEEEAPAAEVEGETVDYNEAVTISENLTGTLKLGMIGPLTGAAALYGTAVANAGQIAVDELNAVAGDFQIDYQTEDDEHDAEKSVNAYNTLKDWDVQAIVGTVTTTPCIAVSPEANADRVFMLTPSASGSDVPKGKDQTFQLCFSDPNQGLASAQYIKDNNLAEKVAIIYNNSDAYSTGIYQTFVDKAAEIGLEVVSTTTFTDDTANDFSVQLTDAQKNGADLVFLPIYYTPASLILKQADSTGYAPKFFGVDGMDGILSLEGFDTKLAEGVLLLTPFAADAEDALTKSFVAKYQAGYKDVPNQFAADAYDCVYAIYAALGYYADNNGGLDVTGMSHEELCEILVSVFTDTNFTVDGLTGEGMTWTTGGEVNKAPKAVVIENGVYVGL